MRARSLGTLNGIAIAIALVMGTTSATASAQVQAQAAETRRYEIPAGLLRDGLRQFGLQSRLQVLAPPELTGNLRGRAVTGNYTARQVLEQLLESSGLSWEFVNATTVVIKQVAVPVVEAGASAPRQAPVPRAAESEPTTLEAITITGTRIRGGATPSPVITIGVENIREEGFTDLGEVIRSVPQNFSGGQNPGVPSLGYAGAGMQNQNITGGSALNLRGLGPDATLTLLNGRRMAYGGMTQAVDINAIPVEAVDRMEILVDGASAIYGSDAVGGVGNVILKRDFDGVAIGALIGTATDGGLMTREYTATAGTTWDGGGLIATFKEARADPIYVRQREYTRGMRDPTTLYPGNDLRSGLLSVHHAVSEVAELSLDALATRRDQMYNLFSPNGRINRVSSDTTTTLVAPSIQFFLPGDWTLSLGATRSRSEHLQYQHWETPATGAVIPSVHDCLCNDGSIYEVGAEGALFALPGGEARIALGLGYRKNEYLHFNHFTGVATTAGDESSRFAYLEANLPVVGEASGIAGVQRLSLTAALRGEDYASFGSVRLPKFGVVYGPSADFTAKASWGKSFKAPTLHQRHFAPYVMLTAPDYFGGVDYPPGTTVLATGGGNRELGPERARTWTASLAFHPVAVPGLDVELTWFDIDYTDRALEPITNFAEALSNPIFAQFIEPSPTDEVLAQRIAAASTFYNFAGVPYDPGDVAALINLQYTNVARQRIKGVDLSGSYRFDLGAGRMTVRGSTSWLDSTQQSTALQQPFDLAGTLNNPPKFSGRVGGIWSVGGFSASAFVNHMDGVTNAIRAEETGSFTTVDMSLRFAAAQATGPLSGLEFSLSAQNLFDRAPPLHTSWMPGYSPPYDATNYSAIGRYLSIGVSKRW